MMKKISAAVVAILWCFAAASSLPAGAQHHGKRKITDAEARAVIQAVEDEVYDYGYQEEYAVVDVPPACGPRKNANCIPIYINPEIEVHGTGGEVIYKLMPSGEVFRMKRDWLKSFFVVDESPDAKRVAEASRRQKLRTGRSHREDVEWLKQYPSE